MTDIKNILVPLDFSEVSGAALIRGISLAKLFEARVHLLHALTPRDRFGYSHEFASDSDSWEREKTEAEKRLAEAEGEVQDAKLAVTASLVELNPVSAIADAAEERQADMIVMGTHGFSGVRRVVLGSVAETVLRTLHLPVVAVKGAKEIQSRPIRSIVLATDFSEQAQRAADFSGNLARASNASLEVVHALDFANAVAPYGVPLSSDHLIAARAATSKKLEEVRESLGEIRGELSVFQGEGGAPYIITSRAQHLGADVIVMGTHGFTGFKHVLMGSVAERVLRLAHCTVIAVRH